MLNLDELYYLSNWILVNFEEQNITNEFTSLVNVINKKRNDPSLEFTTVKQTLIEKLTSISLDGLSEMQREYLNILGLGKYFGGGAKDTINFYFSEYGNDFTKIFNELNVANNELNKGKEQAKKISESIEPFIKEQQNEAPLNKSTVRVRFADESGIRNVTELEKMAKDFKMISIGFSNVVGSNPDEMKITGVSNGSVILNIALVGGIIKVFASATNEVLSIINGILDIKIKREEIKKMNMKPELFEQVDTGFEAQLEEIKISTISNMVTRIKNENPDFSRTENKLEKACEKYYDFVINGGSVEISPNNDSIDEEEQQEIKRLVLENEKLKQEKLNLEDKIKLLVEDTTE